MKRLISAGRYVGEPEQKELQVAAFFEPVDLGTCISVHNVRLVVLERPRDDDQDIAFTYPHFLFYLAFYSPEPRCSVNAFHPDMVCTHHQLGIAEHLTVPLVGQADPDNLPVLPGLPTGVYPVPDQYSHSLDGAPRHLLIPDRSYAI